MSLHYPNPVSVQVLRKADKSPVLKPYVVEAREFLIEIFGVNKTKKLTKTTKHVTKEIAITAEYSTIFGFNMLAVLFVILNILIYRRRWIIYTVQSNDSLEEILSQFIMTESALIRANPALKTLHKNTEKIVLLPGLQLRVRNRHFSERDYLDQLRHVLNTRSSHFSGEKGG